MTFVFFFFSSRRRHTRWPRDWSSDVCSSDLTTLSVLIIGVVAAVLTSRTISRPVKLLMNRMKRSEERRVGKECMFLWSMGNCDKEGIDWIRDRGVEMKRLRGVGGQNVDS